MPAIVKFVELPGPVTLPYVEQGDPSGIPVVLLHGLADSWRSFELVLPHLPSSIHVFALTQRGHGDASRPMAGYRTIDFAADLGAFMDRLHLEAAVIVGGSSGGLVARQFTMDHPNQVLGLVLLGTPLTLRNKPGIRELWESTISRLTDPVDPSFVRAFQQGTLAQPIPPAFLEMLVQESLKLPAQVWVETVAGLLEDNSSEQLKQIQAPTLIVWGDQDVIVSRSEQETLAAAIAGARLLVYSGAGHAFYWEEPARVAADLVTFVQAVTN